MKRQQNHRFRIYVILILTIFLAISFFVYLSQLNSGRVLQLSDDVQVTAVVQECYINIRVHPEKRIPRIGNWGNISRVQIYDPQNNNLVLDYSGLVTDNNGEGSINLCEENVVLENREYNFYIIGGAHLRKFFPSELYLNITSRIVDFTTGGRVLLAGDTSVIKDEKINSLDISTQINSMYTGDMHNDLNRDGDVNSLDISNTIYNFYLLGD